MFLTILGYLFLFIFGLTAILTILSLPNWISIPEWYRKKLFVALILEVVGAIIILFNQSFLNTPTEDINYNISNNDVIVLNDSALIVQPTVTFSTNDTTYEYIIGKSELSVVPDFNCSLTSEGLIIKNSDNTVLGKVPIKSLSRASFFNSIKTAKGEVSSTQNYTVVKWNKNDESQWKWKKDGAYLKPFDLKVYEENLETKYQIINTVTNETIFSSDSFAKSLFDVDNRIIHFLEHDRQFFLLRIVEADLVNTETQYTHILQIRFEPFFKN